MPAVEALGFGLPTLTTRCMALPEAALGMAHYVDDPGDTDEWAERLDALIGKERLSVEAIERIHDHYNVRSIGQRYLQVLSED